MFHRPGKERSQFFDELRQTFKFPQALALNIRFLVGLCSLILDELFTERDDLALR